MSDTEAGLSRKIASAGDLQAVVRTMKAVAASSIGQYERSVLALKDYDQAVKQGLGACFRGGGAMGGLIGAPERHGHGQVQGQVIDAIIFGSDQGLVGQFNDVVADFAIQTLAVLPGKLRVWAVGERVHARLLGAGLKPFGVFTVPNSVKAISPLIGQIQVQVESHRAHFEDASVYVFHNRPRPGSIYEPMSQRLLPLDGGWIKEVTQIGWPTGNLPEVLGDSTAALRALIREFLFISIYKACAESLASENASRLAAMQRADKNISELLESLRGLFHRLRQDNIDEELFDVVSGFEALGVDKRLSSARQ